ncbi:MAG: hypothetical protein IIB46_03105 [Nitrospinae bacterium]|nr:hypothetical protein [Nitrospinota bacterium]
MKKMVLVAFILSIFGLFLNVVNAEDIVPVPEDTVEIVNTDNAAEPNTKSIQISGRDFNSHVPFMLQQDHKVCIDQCSDKHTSCISGTGNNPTAINNCDEQRWRCTLSCDNKYYGSHTF